MDKKQALIRQCRYYSGQEASPFNDATMDWFWDMERVYVSSQGQFIGERDYYKQINGKPYPGIPFDLLMVMFTSWGKTTYSIKDSINNFYKLMDEYLFIANDHCPEDKIPGQ